MMNRRDALQILARAVRDEIVVATYSSASDWIEILDRPLNYFFFGAMGLASSHGLGLALGRPDRRIIVLDGDGSLLMNLGTLVTIAAAAPANLAHLVFVNGAYEANGGHPIPNRDADFAGLARAAGIENARTLADLAAFENDLPNIFGAPGPIFRSVQIDQGPLGPRSYVDMYRKERRDAFRAALAAAPSA